MVIDSAVLWPNGKIYFFDGSQYYRYDIAGEVVDPGFPQPIAANWRGLPTSGLQGAIAWPNGKAYFFRDDQYYRYDIAADAVDPGFPLPIATNWKGILQGPFGDHRIETAVLWPNGKAYMFQHDLYYRYDVAADKVDPGYPELISKGWKGLFTGPTIKAGFVWPKLIDGRQKAYFFLAGGVYVRYDVANDSVDPGYPQPVAGNWRGL
jgi:Hemopexin